MATDGTVVFSDRPCPESNRTPNPKGKPAGPPQRGAPGGITHEQRQAFLHAWGVDLNRQLQAKGEAAARQAKAIRDAAAASRPRSSSVYMPFQECRATVRQTLLSVAGKARTQLLFNTPKLISARICTQPPESVLVTCSALDNRMVTTVSPNSGQC